MDTAISKRVMKALENQFEKARASGRNANVYVNSIIPEEEEPAA